MAGQRALRRGTGHPRHAGRETAAGYRALRRRDRAGLHVRRAQRRFDRGVRATGRRTRARRRRGAHRALAPLAPGQSGARIRAASLVFTDSAPRRALGFFAIASLKADAIPLESRDSEVAVAARRAGAGRVIQVGYDDSWRWRLQGPAGSPEAHRAWWATIVSSAAYRPTIPLTHSVNSDAAPLAQLYSALGPPSAERRAPSPAVQGLPWWMLTVMILSLLAEITSRRLRGAP